MGGIDVSYWVVIPGAPSPRIPFCKRPAPGPSRGCVVRAALTGDTRPNHGPLDRPHNGAWSQITWTGRPVAHGRAVGIPSTKWSKTIENC